MITETPNVLMRGEGVSCCDHEYLIHTVNMNFKCKDSINALLRLGDLYKIYSKQHEKFWEAVLTRSGAQW